MIFGRPRFRSLHGFMFSLRRRHRINIHELPETSDVSNSVYMGRRPAYLSFVAHLTASKYTYTSAGDAIPINGVATDTFAHWDIQLTIDSDSNTITYVPAGVEGDATPTSIQVVILANSLCNDRAIDDFFAEWYVEHSKGSKTPMVMGYNGPSNIVTLMPGENFKIVQSSKERLQWLGDEPTFKVFKVVYADS